MAGSKDSEVHGETVAPEAIEFLYFDKHPQHNAIWDMAAAPGGLIHIGLCNEGLPGLCAQLYVYDVRRRAMRHAFSVDEVTHDDVSDGHMPQSKFHTNMGVGRDGRLYAPTHTTAPGLGHEFRDMEQVFDNRDAAYPGSHYIVYDPQSGRAEDLGIPVPWDSTYGGVFAPERGVHYMITYLRGRLYAFEPAAGRVRDLGRVNMGGQCCLFRDWQGQIFGTEADGHLWRYDPDRDRLEHLSVRMPRPPDRERLITALQEGDWGPDGKFYAAALYEGRLWSYDPFDGRQGRFEDLGFVYDRGTSSILFGSGAVGSDGRIYWRDGCSALRPARLVIFDPARARGRERAGPRVTLSTRPAAQSNAGAARAEAARQKEARSGDFKVDESRLDLIRLYRHVLPAGKCAVTALACARSSLYAATSAKRCHILRIVARRVREVLTIPRRGRIPALVIEAGKVWAAFSPEGKGHGMLLELSPDRGRHPAIDLPPGTSSVLNMIRCCPGRLVLLTGDGALLEYVTRKPDSANWQPCQRDPRRRSRSTGRADSGAP